MVYLFIGMVIGGTAGLFTGCLLTTAKEADKEIERLNKELNVKNTDWSFTLLLANDLSIIIMSNAKNKKNIQ